MQGKLACAFAWEGTCSGRFRPRSVTIKVNSRFRSKATFYRDCQRLGLRLPWKQAITTIRCS